MGVVQQVIAFVVFVVRSIGGLVRSFVPGGERRSRPKLQPQLALAESRDGVAVHPTAPTVEPLNPPTNAEVEAVVHHLPRPTIWPAVIGFGTTLLGFGVMSSLTFAICGAVILLIGVGGWIVELRHA